VVYHYSIVRYVPDPIRGEQLNVGVVVVAKDGSYIGARFAGPPELARLRRLGFEQDFAFVRDLAEEIESQVTGAQLPLDDPQHPHPIWTFETVQRAAEEWANTVQLSEPRSAVDDTPEALLATLFARYVALRAAPQRERARDKRWIKQKVTRTLRQTLATLERDPDEYVGRDERIGGALDVHVVDYVLRNSDVRHVVETMSFETTNRRALKTEVDAFAWTIDDLRAGGLSVPITVATIGGGRLLEEAERVYTGLGADVVREPALDPWVDELSRSLVASLH
jgi:hypothetical protein